MLVDLKNAVIAKELGHAGLGLISVMQGVSVRNSDSQIAPTNVDEVLQGGRPAGMIDSLENSLEIGGRRGIVEFPQGFEEGTPLFAGECVRGFLVV